MFLCLWLLIFHILYAIKWSISSPIIDSKEGGTITVVGGLPLGNNIQVPAETEVYMVDKETLQPKISMVGLRGGNKG